MIILRDGTIPALVSVAGLAGFLVYHLWSMRKRTADMRTLAADRGFHFLGSAIPASIQFGKTSLQGISSTSNGIEGTRNGIKIMAFDCRIGTGKGSRTRTVLAVRTSGDVKHDFSLSMERAGDWTILFEPFNNQRPGGRIIPVHELAAHLNNLDL